MSRGDTIIELLCTPGRGSDQLLHECRAMTFEEGQRLAAQGIAMLKTDRNLGGCALDIVSCFVVGAMNSWHRHLINLDDLHTSPFWFLGADDSDARYLLHTLANITDWSLTPHRLDRTLRALAWMGTQSVQAQFEQWQESPPAWARQYPIKPTLYPFEAGWMLSDRGRRRDLFYPTSYALRKQRTPDEETSLKAPTHTEQNCPWCSHRLYNLIDLDLTSPALAFLEVTGQRLCAMTCLRCTWFGVIYSEIDLDGHAHWSDANTLPDGFDPGLPLEELAKENLALGEIRRTPYEGLASDAVNLYPVSQVGGYPCWWNDAKHPECPQCHSPMKNIARIDATELFNPDESYADGTYYAFLCASCLVTATSYEQT